jgi:hypothetical protein
MEQLRRDFHGFFCFFVSSFHPFKTVIMKKTLFFLGFSLFLLQTQVFATIQSTKAVLQETKPHLSFKQRVFTYFMQRKIRRLKAQNPVFFAQKDSSDRECVFIKLKQGQTISAKIISMDEKNIIYTLCNQANTAEGTVRLEQVNYVTDAQHRMIFNNQPKTRMMGVPTKGDKYARTSITALVIALGSLLLGIISTFTGLFALDEEGIFAGLIFGLVFVFGIITSFISGIMSLSQIAHTPPNQENSKFLAVLSTIIGGLFTLLLLLTLADNF